MIQDNLPKPGSVIGDYKIESVLGQGGYAIVYAGTHQVNGYPAAIKVMLPNIAASVAGVAERFLREIDLAKRLEHPNIVRLYGYGQTNNGLLWMGMELVKGREIAQLLEEHGKFEAQDALKIFTQCLEGLAVAHQLNIVHRDLKPSNIMLIEHGKDKGSPKLLDFGIGKAVGEQEDPSVMDVTAAFGKQMLATPHYASPEILKGKEVSPASDVYAMGLIFFEMLTGQQAVVADSIFEVFAKQAYQELTLPEWLKQSPLGAIILKATAKEPAERYQDAAAFHEALQEVKPEHLAPPSEKTLKKEEKARKKREREQKKALRKAEKQLPDMSQTQDAKERSIALQAAALEAMRKGEKSKDLSLAVVVGVLVLLSVIALVLFLVLR